MKKDTYMHYGSTYDKMDNTGIVVGDIGQPQCHKCAKKQKSFIEEK